MLTKDTLFRLEHAVTDEKIADEIAARLISETPATPAEAQDILDLLDQKKSKSIEERLVVALAGDRQGAAGKELAKKLNAMIDVLKAKANGDEIAAIAASFEGQVAGMTTDVTIVADDAGIDGNSVTLSFDGLDDIDAVLAAWNLANPANTATLASGDGSQIPDNLAEMQLAGGAEASDADLAPAKAKMGAEPMSEQTRFALEHALTSKDAADEFKAAFDAMVAAVQAIS